MSPSDRKLVIARLRLIAQEWYDDSCADSSRYGAGICYAARHCDGVGSWYDLLGEAFELLGMDCCAPFVGEACSLSGDWTVRPMFCLLMADALEQME